MKSICEVNFLKMNMFNFSFLKVKRTAALLEFVWHLLFANCYKDRIKITEEFECFYRGYE